MKPEPDDFEPFDRYLTHLNDDPVRVRILAACNFVEEIIEWVIAESVPNSECFEVPKMRFVDKLRIVRKLYPDGDKIWQVASALNELRAAAAHRNYEELRDERFSKLAEVARYAMSDLPDTISDPSKRTALLNNVAGHCFWHLNLLRKRLASQT